MGKSDRRHSLKMRRRERHERFKERMKRHREKKVAPAAAEKTAKEPAT